MVIVSKPGKSMELKIKPKEKRKRAASPQYRELPEKREKSFLRRNPIHKTHSLSHILTIN